MAPSDSLCTDWNSFETNSILIPVNWLAQIALMLYLSILHWQGLPHLLFLRYIGHQYRRNHLCIVPGSEEQDRKKKKIQRTA